MDGSLFERGKALEDHFFSQRDQKLLEQLQQEISQKDTRDALAQALGITDEDVLDGLVENQVTAESLTGLSLVPLVVVAWADGVMESAEKNAILKAADAAGIAAGSASYQLVESWLQEKPGEQLLAAWRDYISALKSTLNEPAFAQLKAKVIGRAQEVADAAGGFLGIGRTSQKESAAMAELVNAFQ